MDNFKKLKSGKIDGRSIDSRDTEMKNRDVADSRQDLRGISLVDAAGT